MLRNFAFLLPFFLAVAGCAHPPTRDIELHGRLTLRGNEPFAYPVVVDPSGIWRLEGIGRPQATALQNRVVRVVGSVSDETTGEPTVQVRSISVDEAASR